MGYFKILKRSFIFSENTKKNIFRREDPMKLKIITRTIKRLDLFFGEKFNQYINNILYEYILNKGILKSSSRDNSIMFIRVLIGINVCDLDVELNIFICAEAYKKRSVRPYTFT